MDAKEYEKITNAFNLLKFLAPAEEDVKEGRYTEARISLRRLSVSKTYSVNISQNAQNDLEHIFSYIAADSINNAKRFF